MKKKRIIIADDHQIVIDGLSLILSKEKDIEIVNTALNGQKVIDILKEGLVDLVVMDIEMPILNGIETTEIIKKDYPSVKVLILSMYNTPKFVQSIVEIGADGYILKNKGQEELVDAIRFIMNGEDYFGREVERTLREGLKKKRDDFSNVKLTKREKDVLKLIANGDTTPIISEKLFIAHSTVETHRRNLIEKTGVRNSKGLVKYAYENELI